MFSPNFINCKMIQMVGENNTNGHVIYEGIEQFPHWHSDFEFFLVKKGSIWIEVGRKKFEIREGEMIFIPSNAAHIFMSSEEKTLFYNARIQNKVLLDFKMDDFFKKAYVVKPSFQLEKVFEELIFSNYGEQNELYTTTKLVEIYILLKTNESQIIRWEHVEKVSASDITVRIQKFIEKSLTQNITLSDLADYLGINENYCSSLVKQKTDFNFKEYVNYVRLREAEKYLRSTDMKILDICFSVGFNSVQSFNRNFKKYKGMSPTEYRSHKLDLKKQVKIK